MKKIVSVTVTLSMFIVFAISFLATGSASAAIIAPSPTPTPTSTPAPTDFPIMTDECKNSGWVDYLIFKNQGDCVSYVATDGSNPPALLP